MSAKWNNAKWNKEKSPSVSLWRDYKKNIYLGEITPNQEIQCSRAFYGGMMAAFSLMARISVTEEDEEVGAQRLEGLRRDIAHAAADTLPSPSPPR